MIELLARGRCSEPGCERYVPRPGIHKTYQHVPNGSLAYLATDATLVLDEARRRGWSIYPLLDPECAAVWHERLVRDGQQDRGTVREPGEGPERS